MMITPGMDYSKLGHLQKLHLGCGQNHEDGWINADYIEGGKADILFDVQEPWPFKDNSASSVFASHMLEHLPKPMDFFREMHRCVAPGGDIVLRLPYGACDSAMSDVTHIRPWYAESFLCLQPGYGASTGNPQHDQWMTPYGVERISLRLSPRVWRFMKWPFKRVFMSLIDYLKNVIVEIFAFLYPLKSPEAIEAFMRSHSPRSLYCEYSLFDHEVKGRPWTPGTPRQLVPLVYHTRGIA